MDRNKNVTKWSWTSAVVGAATATAAAALILAKPKTPTIHLLSIRPTSITDLILTVHVTNPNIVPVHYSSSSVSISYDGTLLGSAQVAAGSQAAMSCGVVKVPARVDGVKLGRKRRLLWDVRRREMVVDARVEIGGMVKVLWWWEKRFSVTVESRVVVDPLVMDVIQQENKTDLNLFFTDRGCHHQCPMIMET